MQFLQVHPKSSLLRLTLVSSLDALFPPPLCCSGFWASLTKAPPTFQAHPPPRPLQPMRYRCSSLIFRQPFRLPSSFSGRCALAPLALFISKFSVPGAPILQNSCSRTRRAVGWLGGTGQLGVAQLSDTRYLGGSASNGVGCVRVIRKQEPEMRAFSLETLAQNSKKAGSGSHCFFYDKFSSGKCLCRWKPRVQKQNLASGAGVFVLFEIF